MYNDILAQALIRIRSSRREVAQRFNHHHPTVDRLIDRYHKTYSVQNRPRSGRPTVTNPRQDQHVTLTHTRNRFLTAASTVGRIQHTHQITKSTSTVQHCLRTAGLTSRRPYRDSQKKTTEVGVCQNTREMVQGHVELSFVYG